MSATAHQAAPKRSHVSTIRKDEAPTHPPLVAVPAIPHPAVSASHMSDPRNLELAEIHDSDQIAEPRTHFVQSLAVVIFEIIEGARNLQQLGGSVTLRANRQIAGYRAARLEQRTVLGIRPSTVHHVGRVRIDRPAVTVAEVATIVYIGKRARAVALRLEWEHSRWRASDIAVL